MSYLGAITTVGRESLNNIPHTYNTTSSTLVSHRNTFIYQDHSNTRSNTAWVVIKAKITTINTTTIYTYVNGLVIERVGMINTPINNLTTKMKKVP